MRLSLVVAMTASRVIGRGGGLPWKLSSDLKRFKQLTLGHHLLMGRKTYQSIGKPLPGRATLVLRRPGSAFGLNLPAGQQPYHLLSPAERRTALASPEPPPLGVADSLPRALDLARHDTEVLVVGGGEIYALALPQADRLYITWVDAEVAGDAWFPPFDLADWSLVSETSVPAGPRDEYPTRYCVYDRRQP